ncbi:protein-methionine-sulfoxide reductase catalytic subunit MsrP, partial [Chloroflexus sp.]|uniref:protein-methionine-sulfoxide reductase catalytic subunit MsrP n=1 Tax=Chloroflexus sp. TaxID=1904827 RepID=UPI002ACE63A2
MYRDPTIRSSDITPESVYLNRRTFLRGLGALGAGALLSACGINASDTRSNQSAPTNTLRDELGDPANTFEQITTYNNFYEFTTNKEDVARRAANFVTKPWTVEVTGMVHQPRIFAIEDILQMFDQEERIYRLRCVEGWSMVIPWQGFPLHKLLTIVEPTAQAQYVRFETLYDPDQMPGQRDRYFPWPYVEGLRLDEAMHDLTIL